MTFNPTPAPWESYSIADYAHAMLQITHLRAEVGHNAQISYAEEIPADKSHAAKLLDEIATDENIRHGRMLIQFNWETLPETQRKRAQKLFYAALKKADTPMHALQQAIEQATGKSLLTLFREN